jgi:transposase
MATKQRREFTPEFKREAVGLLNSSGRTIRQIAGDLDLGLSTLNRWRREQRDAEPLTTPDQDMTKELARLRKENEILRQERYLLKKATAFFVKETSPPLDGVNTVCRAADEVQAHRYEQGRYAG